LIPGVPDWIVQSQIHDQMEPGVSYNLAKYPPGQYSSLTAKQLGHYQHPYA